MPKHRDADDLDEEEGEEEETEDDADEEEADEEAEEEEETDTPPAKSSKVKKVPAKTTGKKMAKSSGLGFGIVLYEGRPVKVDVVAIRGEIAKVRKPGSEDTPIKLSSGNVRVYDVDDFDKLVARWDKICALKDSNLAAHQKLPAFKSKGAVTKRKRRGNPLDGLL